MPNALNFGVRCKPALRPELQWFAEDFGIQEDVPKSHAYRGLTSVSF